MPDRKIVQQKFDKWLTVSLEGEQVYQILQGSYSGLRVGESRQRHPRERINAESCPCCAGAIVPVADLSPSPLDGFPGSGYHICEACGFWRYGVNNMVTTPDFTVPFTLELNSQRETPSLIHLASAIYERPELLHKMESTRFEKFVGSVLREFFHCDVWHVGRSGDDGIDLVVVEKEEPMLVQVKRRTKSSAVEGIDIVKLLFASAFVKGSSKGMVVTTAQRFSRVSKKWIQLEKLKDLKFSMELVDVNRLLSMMHAVRPPNANAPWENHKATLDSARRPSILMDSDDARYRFVQLSDGIAVCDTRSEDNTVYLLDSSGPNSCHVTSNTEFTLEYFTANAARVAATSVESILNKSASTVLKIDDLVELLDALDHTIMNEIIELWWQNDPGMLINLI